MNHTCLGKIKTLNWVHTLIKECSSTIESLAQTDPSFQVFHRYLALQCTLFNILQEQRTSRGESFYVDLSELTFGRVDVICIDDDTVKFIEQAQYSMGGNQERMFKLWRNYFEFCGYTDDTVPIAVLYVVNFVVNDVLENLPYLVPGRALVDVGSSIGLADLFLRHFGFTQAYMIDINEDALAAGRMLAALAAGRMLERLELSGMHFLKPEEWESIPADQIDLIHSFRSWLVKYPFEEYESLFLEYLKPGLRAAVDIKEKWTPAESSTLIVNAQDRFLINGYKRTPRIMFVY